jgi:hypothetical protein
VTGRGAVSTEENQSKKLTLGRKGGLDAEKEKVLDRLFGDIICELASRLPDTLLARITLPPECAQEVYIETNDEVVKQLVGLVSRRLDLVLELELVDEMMDDLAPRRIRSSENSASHSGQS